MAISIEIRTLIFNKIKMCLGNFVPPLVVATNSVDGSYEVIGNHPVPYGYDKKMVPGMFFASIVHRKDSVAFHYFPIYMNPGLLEIAPTLNKFLKGKTCYHFKEEAQVIETELNLLLEEGIKAWKKFEYII